MRPITFNLLQKSLQRLGIAKQIEALDVLDLFKGWVKDRFGAAAAGEVDPTWIKQGSLGVRVQSGPLREEIKNKEGEILSLIQKQKPEAGVKRIRFIL